MDDRISTPADDEVHGQTGVGLCVPTFLDRPQLTAREWDPRWSHAAGVTVSLEKGSGTARVVNIGDVGTQLGELQIVVWEMGADGLLKASLACEDAFSLPAAIPGQPLPSSPIPFSLPITIDPQKVTHVYAVAYDPIFDPLDAEARSLVADALNGTANPGNFSAATSRHVACWTPPTKAFRVEAGNKITYQRLGLCTLQHVSQDVTHDAKLLLHQPSSIELNNSINTLAHSHAQQAIKNLPLGNLVFRLISNLPQTCDSSDGGRACLRVGEAMAPLTASGEGDLLEIGWEIGNDHEFGDYVILFQHR